MNNIYLYIFLMFAVTYAVRILPLTLIRKPIENRFVKSFLFYVPYVTLAVMTFPAIIDASGAVWVGGNHLHAFGIGDIGIVGDIQYAEDLRLLFQDQIAVIRGNHPV